MTDVRMPDGRIVRGVPDGITQEDLIDRVRQKDLQDRGGDDLAKPPAPSVFDKAAEGVADPFGVQGALEDPSGAIETVKGVADVARSAVTGIGADVAGGLAGLATLGSNAVGLTNDDPVAVIRSWQALAYKPETETGKKIAGKIASATEATVGKVKSALGEHIYKVTGNPMEATVAELMPDALLTISGAKVPQFMKETAMKGAAEITRDALLNQTRTQALRTGRQAGFKVSPAEYGGTVGKNITSMSNRAEVAREISLHNEKRVVELFKVNQELPDTAPVDRGTFNSLRAKWGLAYEKARSLPPMRIDPQFIRDFFDAGKQYQNLTKFFKPDELVQLEKDIASLRGTYLRMDWDADSAVNMMAHLRESSADLMRSEKHIDRKLGHVQREMAQAFEDRLWRHASKEGHAEMASDFQSARRKLAQLHVWEDAANFSTGYISPRAVVAIRKALNARVDPFTDELKTVADSAGAFPQSFQDIMIKGGTMPISVFERYLIVGSTVGGTLGALSGSVEGTGIGAAAGGAIATSGIAGRGLMKSDFWQSRIKPQTGDPGALRSAAMGIGPEAEAAGAVAGAEAGNQ